MAAADRGVDARLQFGGERLAVIEPHRVDLGIDRLGDHRPGEPRSRSARAAKVAIAAASADSGPGAASAARRIARDFALGDGGDQRGDQIGLGREIAIDRAGGDAGALGDRRDLHRRHAAFGGDRARGVDDRARGGGQPADDVVGAAIGHDKSES